MRKAILERVSTRTFGKEVLSKKQIDEIKAVIDKYKGIKGPFGNSFEFTFNLNSNNEGKKQKIGFYGMIKNVPAYIGGVSLDTRNSIIDFGYLFEKVILELTTLGYDTCWLGGSFRRSTYRKKLAPNEVIPAICPVGHRADQRSFLDKRIRSAAQSHKRLPFGTLFQYFDEEKELEETTDSRFIDIMHLIQRGPSASNKQPWRFFVAEKHDVIYAYLERTEGYGIALGYDIQALDAGIALAHLEIGLENYDFKFDREEETKGVFFDGLEYIMTYKRAITE
ncbi:Nitroreductase family protein [Candidatus Izimaplasma bacterium HR1]|uniref:nitroreductase family protein n=1 Tax=Candidatus Izimoplasma sp. HR1 TaxID=1541959 RepID=UPI0004F7BBFF|nr:Nitroreductase family protein [Candidatus Izimaplasma bacterium HR1]